MTLAKPVMDPDVWWHLASGRYMVETKSIPRVDVFSLTCRGSEWINSYWLLEAAAYGVMSVGGLGALILLHGVAVIVVLGLVEKRLREAGVNWIYCALAALLVFYGSTPRTALWATYASIVTVVYLALLALLIDRWRRRGWKNAVWVGPVLFMTWANLHRGFVFGLVLCACTALLSPAGTKERLRRLGWLASCAAATLINPYGIRLYRMIWDDFHLSGQLIIGWDKPGFQNFEIFWAVAAALWIFLILGWARRRKIDWADAAAFAFLTGMSAKHFVSIPAFMVFAVPFIATRLPKRDWGKYELNGLLAGSLLFLIGAARTDVKGGASPHVIPEEAFDFIEQTKSPAPYYNDYMFGGYWMWRFNGEPAVFIDGRYPGVIGYQPLFAEINRAQFGSPADWQALLEKYSIQTALLRYRPAAPLPSLYETYMPRATWALVYWDDAGLLFLRRTPAARKIIEAWEFKEVLPDASQFYFEERVRTVGTERRKRMAYELDRNRSLHPQSTVTRKLMNWFKSSRPRSS